jgi:hypothetical protein
MFLDGGEEVGLVVVAIGCVVFGELASHLIKPWFFENHHAQMTVQQHVFRLVRIRLDNSRGLDQANFMHR